MLVNGSCILIHVDENRPTQATNRPASALSGTTSSMESAASALLARSTTLATRPALPSSDILAA
jgi:hypothetical protein